MTTDNKNENDNDDITTTVRSRGWLLTIMRDGKHSDGTPFHYDVENIESVLDGIPWMGQLESGHETHREHFQIYIERKNPMKLSTIRRLFSNAVHAEPRRGTKQQAFDYCSKVDTRIDGPWFHGITADDVVDASGVRTDLASLQDAVINQHRSINEILLDADLGPLAAHCIPWLERLQYASYSASVPDYRDIHTVYVYGPSGSGKTSNTIGSRAVPGLFTDYYRITDYKNPWDRYAGQSTLILDEFKGQIDFSLLLNVLDSYKCEVPARYSNKIAAWTTVVIISNVPPSSRYMYQYEPDSRWAAFRRRINRTFFIDRNSPADDETADYRDYIQSLA